MSKQSRAGRRASAPGGGRPAQARRSRLPVAVWLGIVGLLVLVAGVLLASRPAAKALEPAQVTGKPKLQVSQDVQDFGKVPLDRPVKATFKLTNTGDRPLTLNGQPTVEVVKGC